MLPEPSIDTNPLFGSATNLDPEPVTVADLERVAGKIAHKMFSDPTFWSVGDPGSVFRLINVCRTVFATAQDLTS